MPTLSSKAGTLARPRTRPASAPRARLTPPARLPSRADRGTYLLDIDGPVGGGAAAAAAAPPGAGNRGGNASTAQRPYPAASRGFVNPARGRPPPAAARATRTDDQIIDEILNPMMVALEGGAAPQRLALVASASLLTAPLLALLLLPFPWGALRARRRML